MAKTKKQISFLPMMGRQKPENTKRAPPFVRFLKNCSHLFDVLVFHAAHIAVAEFLRQSFFVRRWLLFPARSWSRRRLSASARLPGFCGSRAFLPRRSTEGELEENTCRTLLENL